MTTPASTGRAVPPPHTYQFPNGAVATVRQASQFTLATIEIGLARTHPKPTPPLAPGVGGELEPNPADPGYEAALGAWQQAHQLRIFDAMIELFVEVDVDQAALDVVAGALDRAGVGMDEISDKVAYVKHCCVIDIARDLAPVARLINGQVPSEADVQAHVETFRGDVGGAAAALGAGAALEGTLQPTV